MFTLLLLVSSTSNKMKIGGKRMVQYIENEVPNPPRRSINVKPIAVLSRALPL